MYIYIIVSFFEFYFTVVHFQAHAYFDIYHPQRFSESGNFSLFFQIWFLVFSEYFSRLMTVNIYIAIFFEKRKKDVLCNNITQMTDGFFDVRSIFVKWTWKIFFYCTRNIFIVCLKRYLFTTCLVNFIIFFALNKFIFVFLLTSYTFQCCDFSLNY